MTREEAASVARVAAMVRAMELALEDGLNRPTTHPTWAELRERLGMED